MNRGSRGKVLCYDCGAATGAPVQVYRPTRGGGRIATFVHRAGTGCHKGETPSVVREIGWPV